MSKIQISVVSRSVDIYGYKQRCKQWQLQHDTGSVRFGGIRCVGIGSPFFWDVVPRHYVIVS
jgi:hypothetical protein